MRTLTSKQKKILLNWARKNPDKISMTANVVDEIESEIWDLIVAENYTEILYQECNRFLNDIVFETDYKTGEKIIKN